MGVSIALLEELRFDESGVTSADWRSYPIATMADLPEIKVVLINRPEVDRTARVPRQPMRWLLQRLRSTPGRDGQGCAPPPMKPDYVQSLLRA